jgi:hypothetical protein
MRTWYFLLLVFVFINHMNVISTLWTTCTVITAVRITAWTCIPSLHSLLRFCNKKKKKPLYNQTLYKNISCTSPSSLQHEHILVAFKQVSWHQLKYAITNCRVTEKSSIFCRLLEEDHVRRTIKPQNLEPVIHKLILSVKYSYESYEVHPATFKISCLVWLNVHCLIV